MKFFYFGYKDDYKRNPKEFKKTIIGVPIGLLSASFGFFGISNLIKKWINSDNQEIKKWKILLKLKFYKIAEIII